MVISCASPNLGVAIFSAPATIMPLLLLAGFYKNVEDKL
jgi:hypothetical protein